jgi:hypothetical protein
MKHVRKPEPDLDLEAVKLRRDAAMRRYVRDPESVIDSLVDVTSLLAEINRLQWIEREHRYEFADLLAAAREALAATERGERFALLGLRFEVRRHREITAEELDEWRDWSDLQEEHHESSNPDPD